LDPPIGGLLWVDFSRSTLISTDYQFYAVVLEENDDQIKALRQHIDRCF
jgi:hypothetical protein